MKHDAILRNYYSFRSSGLTMYVGNIYNDGKGRFTDGTQVRTSFMVEVTETDEGLFLQTRNTVYKLEEPFKKE